MKTSRSELAANLTREMVLVRARCSRCQPARMRSQPCDDCLRLKAAVSAVRREMQTTVVSAKTFDDAIEEAVYPDEPLADIQPPGPEGFMPCGHHPAAATCGHCLSKDIEKRLRAVFAREDGHD